MKHRSITGKHTADCHERGRRSIDLMGPGRNLTGEYIHPQSSPSVWESVRRKVLARQIMELNLLSEEIIPIDNRCYSPCVPLNKRVPTTTTPLRSPTKV